MNPRRLYRAFAVSFLLLAGASLVLASGTLPPSGRIPTREDNLRRLGQRLFDGKRITGKDGQPCSACHPSTPIRRAVVGENLEELPKLITWCLVTRVKNNDITAGSDKFKAIQVYTVQEFNLDEPLRPESEAGMKKLEEAKGFFSNGEFNNAISAFEEAIPMLVLQKNIIEARLNLALAYQVENNVARMKDQFREILNLDKDYELDADSFPQKTQIIFFQVKNSMK